MRQRTSAFISWLGEPLHLAFMLLSLVPICLVIAFQNTYAANYPRGDQFRTVQQALDTHDGTLDWVMLTAPDDGHIQFFTRLQTVLVTQFADWNLNVEMRINLLLAVLGFMLLVLLTHHTVPTLTAYALVPLSLLAFGLNQDFMWVIGFSSCWYYTNLFVLAAFAIVSRWPNQPVALVLALLAGVGATISFGNGVLVWVVVPMVMGFVGWHKPRDYGLWAVVAIMAIGAFLWRTGIGTSDVEGSPTSVALSVGTFVTALRFTLSFVGGTFTADSARFSAQVAAWGVAFGIVNTIVLLTITRMSPEARRVVGVWLPLALFPVGSGFLAGLTRPDWYGSGVEAALQMQYKTGALLFWVGLLGVTFGVSREMQRRGGWWRLLVVANVAFWSILALIYILANYQSVAADSADVQWMQRIKLQSEECFVQFMFVQDPDYLAENTDCYIWNTAYVNDLAPRRLALFAEMTPTTILPFYTEETPVIVEGEHPLIPVHIADWLLADVPDGMQIAVTPEGDIAGVAEQVVDADSIWRVQRADTPTQLSALWERLTDNGYAAIETEYVHPVGTAFKMTLYERVPDDVTENVTFGTSITLPLWSQMVGQPVACETVTVKTLWRGDVPSEVPLSMTLTLVNDDGGEVARADAQLSLVPSNTWDATGTYPDVRDLTLPCDLPAGTYTLAIGVYDWRDGERLSVTLPDDTLPETRLAPIGELTVLAKVEQN
jgi:hypothetical protein